jgi:ferredoxin/flavodoxin---NADP+ reductase
LLTKVICVRNISPSTYVIRLERNGFKFTPGQCVSLGVKGSGINREYSTYSGVDDPYLEFLIKEVPGGAVSSRLRKVSPGADIEIHGPYGSFTLDPQKIDSSRFVFIGSGTGIAPFHAFVRSYPQLDYQILCGVRTADERYDHEDYDPSRIIFSVSRESWEGYSGRVTGYLEENEVCPSSIYYLCGNQRMIYDVYDLLRQKGVSGDRIFTESFF